MSVVRLRYPRRMKKSTTSLKAMYLDCLRGNVPVPEDKTGFFLFQLLMVGGMISFMVTFNGVRHDGIGFLEYSHWFYPVMFCTAFALRRTVANKITGFLIPRFIEPRLSGVKAAFAKTLANVMVMCPMVSLAVSLILEGQNFLGYYVQSVAVSLPVALCVNYFVVGPIVKTIYAKRIGNRKADSVLAEVQRVARPLTALLGID